MTQIPTQQGRIESIFAELLPYPEAERGNRLSALCGNDHELQAELKSLLKAADRAKGFLSVGPLATSWPRDATLDNDTMLGQQFDSWQIIRELDSGGMGVVFLAERIDGHYQQQVAIKLAKLGLSSKEVISRFHTERQILANLRHRNIAQLLDGGTGPDGHPYLVMEYVQGEAIDTWSDSQQLSIEQILRLMMTVCDAIQYAHRNLVVHCDLKPSNILVSDGVPMLLDFGIATLLGPTLASKAPTDIQQTDKTTPLTPMFASPEQIKGETVTTATDVYALGIVLYRLLTGKHPYSTTSTHRSKIAEMMMSLEIEPPSVVADVSLKSELRGDLDRIVLKALQIDPQQRYTSARDFSTDMSQYLQGFPVSVSPNSTIYRSRKFIERNRKGVSLAIAALVLIWAGSFFSVWQWTLAQERKDLADQRLADVRNMISTLVVDLPEIFASHPGSTPLRVELLDQGIAKLDLLVKTQPDNPELIRELAVAYAQLGRLQGYPASVNLGKPEKAAATYRKSLALQTGLLNNFPDDMSFAVEIAINYSALTLIYFTALRETQAAYEYVEKCIASLKPWIYTADPDVLGWLIGCYELQAKWYSDDREYVKARKAVMSAQELLQSQSTNKAFTQSFMGIRQRSRLHEEWAAVEANSGNKEKALEHERERLDIVLAYLQDDFGTVQLYGPKRITGDAYHAYGARLADLGRLSDAEDAYLQAIRLWGEVSETFPSDFSATRSLVYLYSDYAELHRQIAATILDKNSINRRDQQACAAYESSLVYVKKMGGDPQKITKRYSWSMRPREFRPRYEELCVTATQTTR